MSNNKIIYNEDGSFGVDEDSLNKFDRMLQYNLDNNLTVFDNDIHNNEDESGDWDDFTIKGNTLWL